MYRIQEMMREWHYEEPNGNKTILPAIIKPKYASAQNCIVPPCQSCLIARARKRTPKVLRTRLLEDREGAITRDKYNVGDFVSDARTSADRVWTRITRSPLSRRYHLQ